jgi:hypothetical protein
MLMRLATFSPEERVTEVSEEVVREGLLSTLQSTPGFAGAYFGVNRISGRGISVTLWATQEQLRSSEDAVAAVARRGLQIPNPESVETFEVTQALSR